MSFQENAESLTSRDALQRYDGRARIGIAIVAVAIACIALVGIVPALFAQEVPSDGPDEALVVTPAAAEEEPAPESCLYLTGCVARPGIVYVDGHARLAEAIEAVGGFTADADTASINLAREVVDGEQVHIPRVGENAGIESAAPGSSMATSGPTAAGGKVNLNSASLSDLMSLTGIGEAKASKIIQYRDEHGPFKAVDDLAKVTGIGEKTVDALRDSICV